MITDEQKQVIKMIEENLDIAFKGTTKEEARQFIKDNMKASIAVSDHYKGLLITHYGGYKKIWELLNKQEQER